MTRLLRWSMFLIFITALVGGCESRKDQIPTKIDTKTPPPPELPSGNKKGTAT